MKATIYHIVTRCSWEEQAESSNYIHASLMQEGYIHTSKASQVDGVLVRYYAGVNDLLKLTIDVEFLDATSPLKEEMAESVGEFFPHIYGPINKSAIIAIDKIR